MKIRDVPTLHAIGAESGVDNGIDELFTGETPGAASGESLHFVFPMDPGRLYFLTITAIAATSGTVDGAEAAAWGGGQGITSIVSVLKDLAGTGKILGTSEVIKPPNAINGAGTWTLVASIVSDDSDQLGIAFTDTGTHAKVNVGVRVTGYSIAQPAP